MSTICDVSTTSIISDDASQAQFGSITLTKQSSAWNQLVAVLTKNFYEPPLVSIRTVYSAFAAHYLLGQPVWPMIIAPPGSGKTELVDALVGLPNVHSLDSVTPQTFISGKLAEPGEGKPKQSASLLNRIGNNGIIVIPDYSTVLAIRSEKRDAVYSDLRRIYDGSIRKEFGTAENLEDRQWKGRITMLTAVTPEIHSYQSAATSLGERFLPVKWGRAAGVAAGLMAMRQIRDEAKQELQKAVYELLRNLPKIDPTIATDLEERIASFAELAAVGRTPVSRNRDREITAEPVPESCTRLAQQLAQLAKGSALLAGREEVNEDDFDIVSKAAFDAMRPWRAEIIQQLDSGGKTSEIGAKSTIFYAKEDLETLGLLDGNGRLSDSATGLLNATRAAPRDQLM